MVLESLTLNAAAKLGIPFAESIITDIVISTLHHYLKSGKNRKRTERIVARSLTKYISDLYGKCSVIHTIAFQNSPKKLTDLYVPLTIATPELEPKISLDKDFDIFPFGKRQLLVDRAGMGKSTAVKWIIKTLIERKNYFPILFELRNFKGNQNLTEEIFKSIGMPVDSSSQFFVDLPVLLFFDGFDEIPIDDTLEILQEIRSFINKHPKTFILISSREQPELSEFHDFRRIHIESLSKLEANQLIKKYDAETGLSKDLIKELENSGDRNLEEFLTNPLYVSLLYCAYRHKPSIPRKRYLFYSQVYDALFESHDLTKRPGYIHQKHCKLDSGDFHKILRRLGFWCLIHENKLDFLKERLIDVLSDFERNIPGIKFSAADFLRDLIHTVPIFLKEGNTYKWTHKSLQEYFAAMFICMDSKGKQEDILLRLYRKNNFWSYLNIIELCVEIDYGSFRKTLLKECLENFVKHQNTFLRNFSNRRVKPFDLEYRKSLLFDCIAEIEVIKEVSDESLKGLLEEPFQGNEFERGQGIEKNFVFRKNISFYYQKTVFIVTIGHGKDYQILDLIQEKEPQIFHRISPTVIEQNLRKVKDSSIPLDKPFVVGENSKSTYNNSKNFHLINCILAQFFNVALIYEEVYNLIDKIDTECSDDLSDLVNEI